MRALALRIKAEDVQDKSFCIGFDRRFLSREAAQWAAEVMAGEGIHVLLISREAPTPLIMFTVQYYGLDYGIAVTASHNPALYNGIKVFTKGGRDAEEAVRLIFRHLDGAVAHTSRADEAAMLRAAHYAGRAFTRSYVGYVHAVSHSLSGAYDLPHGWTNAVLLPLVNQAQVFYDARGCTGVRMTLRVG